MVTAEILPSRKNSHGRGGNRTRDLMICSQSLWPLDHEAGLSQVFGVFIVPYAFRLFSVFVAQYAPGFCIFIAQYAPVFCIFIAQYALVFSGFIAQYFPVI